MLNTTRLRLRPVSAPDAEFLLAHWSLPRVRRWLWDNRLPTRDEVDGIIAASTASWTAAGYGFWIIEPIGEHVRIGVVGFREASWEPGVCELVYSLDPAWWGKGIVTEAARAALDWADRTHRWPRIVAATDTPNRRSARVLERVGMRLEREDTLEGGLPTRFYGFSEPRKGGPGG